MDLGLGGKVAMVAAASKGMGHACALALSREGVSVSICARNGRELEEAAVDIRRQTGGQVLALPLDLTRAVDIATWAERTTERFGGVDILVTNAGGPPPGLWSNFQTDAPWRRAFELNFMSSVRMIRAVVPLMRARGGGRIVNIQSTSVREPIPGLILSNTARPGVVGLARSLAAELGPDNILINTIAPGRIDTDRLRGGLVEQARTRGPLAAWIAGLPLVGPRVMDWALTHDIPLRRLGRPAEVAEVVVFLASDRASYVTGETFLLDGGLSHGLL